MSSVARAVARKALNVFASRAEVRGVLALRSGELFGGEGVLSSGLGEFASGEGVDLLLVVSWRCLRLFRSVFMV
jgi:hypothetical protein